jgi:hypothetical protein
VTLRDDSGAVVGTATADGAGAWSIPLPDPGRDGTTLTATQQDAVGNLSSASTPTAPIDFQRPTIVAPAGGTTVSPDGTAVTVEISGTAGQNVQILIDGTWTGNTHTLESTPISRVTPPLASGTHTLAVRYYDPATGRIGSLASITVAVE